MIKVGVGKFVLRSISVLTIFGIIRNYMSGVRSQSFYLCVGRVIQDTVVKTQAYHFHQRHTKYFPSSYQG